jgi:hypothetical protein
VASTTKIEGFRITGAYLLHGSGAGINCDNHSFPTIARCLFIGNTSEEAYGGGLSCHIQSLPTIRECFFVKNGAGAGGAIALSGDSDPLIVDCQFDENTADSGGAVLCQDSSPTLTDCTFLGNRSDGSGGSLFCFYDSQPILIRCTFEDNSADAVNNTGGGAIYVEQQSVVTGTECQFLNNSTLRRGGAVYLWQSRGVFQNCTFTGNGANISGGVAYIGPRFGATEFRNCTFYGNSAPAGAGAYLSSPIETPASAIFQNTIIALGDSGEAIFRPENTIVQIRCCDIFGNAGGDYVGGIGGFLGINGNISEDPLFCDAPNGDLTLSSASPCADAPGCGLIGAHGVGCGVSGIAESNESQRTIRVLSPQPVASGSDIRIAIEVPEVTAGRLAVYSATGRCLTVLRQGEFPRGSQEFIWSTRSKRVPSGVYYLVLSGTGWRVSRPLVVF